MKPSKFKPPFKPSIVYITSLFTWAHKPVREAVSYYKRYYPEAIVHLGGIYASILPDHAALTGADLVHIGLLPEVENLMPDYSLLPRWDASILFATRGCVRRCSFCVVPKLEGRINSPKESIWGLLHNRHSKAILWDNNILAAPNFDDVIKTLSAWGRTVDFNQGVDARLVTPEIANKLSELRMPMLHLAYDTKSSRREVQRAIEYLKDAGFRGKKLIFYTLYNHKEGPEDFFHRLKDLMNWGVVSYPMRFEPLTSIKKNQYISPTWTMELLDMIAKARRVIGFMGAFPPYEGLVKKINDASSLYEAMKLRPTKS